MFARQSTIIKRSICNRHLVRQVNCGDTKDFAFKISLNSALRERGNESRPIIMAELRHMVDKRVWHGVRVSDLAFSERAVIIRSSMIMRDKFTASGEFDKFKARLVAGGVQQEKDVYDNLSPPHRLHHLRARCRIHRGV